MVAEEKQTFVEDFMLSIILNDTRVYSNNHIRQFGKMHSSEFCFMIFFIILLVQERRWCIGNSNEKLLVTR